LARAPGPLDAVSLGVAGPVVGTSVEPTNLPWRIDATVVSSALGGVPVFLLNDLEALAYGVPGLPDDALLVLNPGVPAPEGTRARCSSASTARRRGTSPSS